MTWQNAIRSVVEANSVRWFDYYLGSSAHVYTIYDKNDLSPFVDSRDEDDFSDYFRQVSKSSDRLILRSRVAKTYGSLFEAYIQGKRHFVIPKDISTLYVGGVFNVLQKLGKKTAWIINLGATVALLIQDEDIKFSGLTLDQKSDDILYYNGFVDKPRGLIHALPLVQASDAGTFVINKERAIVHPMLSIVKPSERKLFLDYSVPEVKIAPGCGQYFDSLFKATMKMLDSNRIDVATRFKEDQGPGVTPVDQEHKTGDLLISYQIVFQQLDMIMTLFSRNLVSRPIANMLEAHQIFIDNMPTTDIAYTYIRRPITLYMSNMKQIRTYWSSLLDGGIDVALHYQQYYNSLAKEGIKSFKGTFRHHIYRDDRVLLNESMMLDLEHSSMPKPAIANVRREQPFDDQPHTAIYVQPFRNEKMRKIAVSHWDLKEVHHTNDPGFHYESQGELDLQVPELLHKYVTINGVSFKSYQLRLLYDTFLYQTIATDPSIQHFYFPRLMRKDLLMLRDVLAGRMPLFWFYQNMSNYTYSILSDNRSMLDLYDFLPVRALINERFSIGIPLEQQIMKVDKLVDEISRLKELVEICVTASAHHS